MVVEKVQRNFVIAPHFLCKLLQRLNAILMFPAFGFNHGLTIASIISAAVDNFSALRNCCLIAGFLFNCWHTHCLLAKPVFQTDR